MSGDGEVVCVIPGVKDERKLCRKYVEQAREDKRWREMVEEMEEEMKTCCARGDWKWEK